MDESFAAQIIAYHEASKHHYRTYAPGPGYLDWATQPDPFRRYIGAQAIPLVRPAPDDGVPYEAGFMPGLAPVAPLDAPVSHSSSSTPWRFPPGRSTTTNGGRCASTRPAATCTRPRAI